MNNNKFKVIKGDFAKNRGAPYIRDSLFNFISEIKKHKVPIRSYAVVISLPDGGTLGDYNGTGSRDSLIAGLEDIKYELLRERRATTEEITNPDDLDDL
jgi:hypothetical protein